MNRDISAILADWPYEHGKLNVRIIKTKGGEGRLQVRLDLGIIQMHLDGRPDGQRPHDTSSLLEYHESRLAPPPPGPGEEPPESLAPAEDASLELTEEECRELRDEAIQYYHRYMALLAIDEFEGVIRDTTRNLRMVDFCAKHAANEKDREELEPFRPFIMMIRARAAAGQALKAEEPKAALLAIDEALEALRLHFAEKGELDAFEQSGEVQMLRTMRGQLVPKLPVSQKTELRQRLEDALSRENYELAAILRDELKLLGDEEFGAKPPRA